MPHAASDLHEEGSVHNMLVDNDLHHKANPEDNMPNGNALRYSSHSIRDMSHGEEGLHEADSVHNMQSGL